jgi:hypothetical protein
VFAQDVHGDQVQLLNDLALRRRAAQHLVAGVADRARAGAGHRPRAQAALPGGLDRGQQVGAAAAGGQHDQHVAGAAVRAHLAGEDLLEAVVVADRGERRGVRRQGDRGQRDPVVAQLAGQLGGQMLGLGGAPAVAGHQHPAAGEEVGAQLGAPAGQAGSDAAVGVERRGEGGQVTVQGIHQTATSLGAGSAGTPVRL